MLAVVIYAYGNLTLPYLLFWEKNLPSTGHKVKFFLKKTTLAKRACSMPTQKKYNKVNFFISNKF
jgi:hypothetical protein